MVELEGSFVRGEVFECNDECLHDLDILEGVPRLYRRIEADAKLDSGRTQSVLTYLWNGSHSFPDMGGEWLPGERYSWQ